MKHARKDYNRIQDPENKIPEDEPVFLLRGKDPFAATVVRTYARLCANNGLDQMAQVCHDWADRMDEYRTDLGFDKLPDI